jgi:hypothetical protein
MKKKNFSVTRKGKKLFGAAANAVLKSRAARSKAKAKPKATPKANTKAKRRPRPRRTNGLLDSLKKFIGGGKRRNSAGPSEEAERLYEGFQGRPISEVMEVRLPKDFPDELILLGPATGISYLAAKEHIEGGQLFDWHHQFGEQDGTLPALCADPKTQDLYIIGGNYQIKPEGIVN